MLDHVFMDAIGALRDAFDGALLERHAQEERLQVDVLLGDVGWETSYSLPGEGVPPRVVAEVTLEWPTWSQTAYRSWKIGEGFDEPPEVDVEIVLRLQRLVGAPEPSTIVGILPDEGPTLGDEPLRRSAPTVEHLYDLELAPIETAIEVSYEGVYALSEAALADEASLAADFGALGGWIASSLVKLGDLKLEFRPPDELVPFEPAAVVGDLDDQSVVFGPRVHRQGARRPAAKAHGVGAELRDGQHQVLGVRLVDAQLLEPVGEQAAGQRDGDGVGREAVLEGPRGGPGAGRGRAPAQHQCERVVTAHGARERPFDQGPGERPGRVAGGIAGGGGEGVESVEDVLGGLDQSVGVEH